MTEQTISREEVEHIAHDPKGAEWDTEVRLARALLAADDALRDAREHVQAIRTSYGLSMTTRQLESLASLIGKLLAAMLPSEGGSDE